MEREANKSYAFLCTKFIPISDTYKRCVACLGTEHTSSCTLFDESGQLRASHCSGLSAAEAQQRLRSSGSQMELVEGLEETLFLSQPPLAKSVLTDKSEACASATSLQDDVLSLRVSFEEEAKQMSTSTRVTADSSLQPPGYETSWRYLRVL
ncbi:hypothetical protein Baya_1012 [Bagarius yarrelli]|uniref:Uncharacterized protein n=1 Tax=Bagarius yarrelli TaxID=175774 RepID=A0A556TJW0_BAGYA|nr:hypothetical protein Baya_1012 [Bagarius yarrelli]